jgi:MFS superfamily sulfate permease-like transporter
LSGFTSEKLISVFKGNRYNLQEWAGAFGDLGTLIPFVAAYISVMKLDPFAVLFAFGITKVVIGLFYKTPVPVQPMKAIGATAIAGVNTITPGMVYASGIVTGLIWLILGLTNLVGWVTKLASKPVVRGIVLGLGLLFVTQGLKMMLTLPWLGVAAAALTLLLMSNNKIPVMFILLAIGGIVALLKQPGIVHELTAAGVHFQLPVFSLNDITWQAVTGGALLLALPQVPLTLGNAIIATAAENNEIFPQRKVTEKKLAITTGIMNLFSPIFGGVPLCHGAGGMAGHIRFGARTGGSLVILGVIILVLAFFFADSISIIFRLFPEAILGVILFFAGLELALTVRDIGSDKSDVYVMLVTGGLAMWNMLAAFIAGIGLYWLLKRKWVRL